MGRGVSDGLLVGVTASMLGFVGLLFMQAIWRWGIGPPVINYAVYILISVVSVSSLVLGAARIMAEAYASERRLFQERRSTPKTAPSTPPELFAVHIVCV